MSLLLMLLGGPHSSFSCDFSQDVVFMASLGFVVLMGMFYHVVIVVVIIVCILVNYRGSVGFGQDSVDSLLGKVGIQDINDVHVSDP